MKLVLASASPRRRELLSAMGIDHDVVPSTVDEKLIVADHPRTFAIRAAWAKAMEVAGRTEPGTWVLGADTVVTREMVLYGKPESEADAIRMLGELSGEAHEVITGMALVEAGRTKALLHAEKTVVYFRELTTEEVRAYIQTGEPMDKAGSYGIQGHGGDLIERIDGDYYNVVGLPCRALDDLLQEAGLENLTVHIPDQPERWRTTKGRRG